MGLTRAFLTVSLMCGHKCWPVNQREALFWLYSNLTSDVYLTLYRGGRAYTIGGFEMAPPKRTFLKQVIWQNIPLLVNNKVLTTVYMYNADLSYLQYFPIARLYMHLRISTKCKYCRCTDLADLKKNWLPGLRRDRGSKLNHLIHFERSKNPPYQKSISEPTFLLNWTLQHIIQYSV